jgi:hypothetical protein
MPGCINAQGKSPSTHCVGGWVGPTTHLNALDARNWTLAIQPASIIILSYPESTLVKELTSVGASAHSDYKSRLPSIHQLGIWTQEDTLVLRYLNLPLLDLTEKHLSVADPSSKIFWALDWSCEIVPCSFHTRTLLELQYQSYCPYPQTEMGLEWQLWQRK